MIDVRTIVKMDTVLPLVATLVFRELCFNAVPRLMLVHTIYLHLVYALLFRVV